MQFFTWPLCLLAAAPQAQTAPDAGVQARAITLVAGGDVTLGYHYEEYYDAQIAKGKSRDEMVDWGFARVKAVAADADLFVVNLECPFTARGEKIAKNFNFRARPELVASLLAGGVGAV